MADYGRQMPEERPRPQAGRIWAGGVAAAIVAALVVLVGVLIARGILDIPLLAPHSAGAVGNGSTGAYAALAALAALVATALLHGLLLVTPQPMSFFHWIGGLATLAAALVPFTTGNAWKTETATGLINLVVGVAVISLLSRVGYAAGAALPSPPGEWAQPPEAAYRDPAYDQSGYRDAAAPRPYRTRTYGRRYSNRGLGA